MPREETIFIIVIASLLLCLPIRVTAASEDSLHLQIIVVDSRGKAERVHAALEAGADFTALAKAESIDPAAAEGGDLGLVPRRTLRAELQEALRGLAPGQPSGIVVVPTGFAIVRIAPARMGTGTGDAFSIAGIQFNGIRYPPYTTGVSYIEGLFRSLPKPEGWNDDMKLFCTVHQMALDTAVERLQSLVTSDDPAVQAQATPDARVQAYYMWALFESYQGRMDRATPLWEEAYRVAKEGVPKEVATLEEVLGAAYLHKAEMDNGVYDHPDERCLFPPPPRTAKPFENTDAARKAVEYFTKYLERKPDEPEVKWLLNVTYMMLGLYPEGVPARYLIPPALFKSKQDIGRFTDVAAAVGLGSHKYISGSMVVDDFDGDGLLDIVTSSYDPCEYVHLFHNDGDGTFTDRSATAGLMSVAGGQGIVQADYDNDGCLDMLVLRGAWQVPLPMSLLHNNCDGTFTDVTREAGLRDGLIQTQTAVWVDIDNDGLVDLFVGNETGPSQLFRNLGKGRFENISHAAGVDHTSFVKGVAADDFDNDGYVDLFVSNIRGATNQLYHNNHDGTFTDVAAKAGVAESTASFTTWFFDYDNDGWPDLFVATDFASVDEAVRTYLGLPRNTPPSKLYRNQGDGTFKDVALQAGLDNSFMPMGATYGDADGDGYLDIYLGTGGPDYSSMTPKVLLRNDGGKTFVDVSDSSGTAELHKMHGMTFADLENRGADDIVASMGGAAPGDGHALRLFRNPGHGNDWIDVKLVGVQANRAALGARITVTVENKGAGVRKVCRSVNGGGSFGSSPLAQSIGLGKGARILKLEVVWPGSRTPQTFRNVPVNGAIEIEQSAATYARLERKQYRLGAARNASLSADHGRKE